MRDADEPTRLLPTLALALTLVGCASGPSTPGDAEADPKPAATSPTFGDDPVGVALAWTDAPPEGLPEPVAERMAGWDDPVLLRLFRLSDSEARAVIGRKDGKNHPAVLLRLQRRQGSWSVVRSEPATANHGWPTM